MSLLKKAKIIYLLAAIFATTYTNAQDSVPTQPFIKLKNGSLLQGDTLFYDKNDKRPNIIKLEAHAIKFNDVAFFGNDTSEVYANIGLVAKSHSKRGNLYFFTTISGGSKGGTYSSPRTVRTSTPVGYTHTRTGGGGAPMKPIIRDYFSDGFSKTKRITIYNIAPYIKNDPVMEKKVKKTMKLRNSVYLLIGAGTLFYAAEQLFIEHPVKPSSRNLSYTLGSLSLASFGTSFVFYQISWRKKKRIVEDYFHISIQS